VIIYVSDSASDRNSGTYLPLDKLLASRQSLTPTPSEIVFATKTTAVPSFDSEAKEKEEKREEKAEKKIFKLEGPAAEGLWDAVGKSVVFSGRGRVVV